MTWKNSKELGWLLKIPAKAYTLKLLTMSLKQPTVSKSTSQLVRHKFVGVWTDQIPEQEVKQAQAIVTSKTKNVPVAMIMRMMMICDDDDDDGSILVVVV